MAAQAQKIVKVTSAMNAAGAAAAEQGCTGMIAISFYRDGSFNFVALGNLQLTELVTASNMLASQVAREFSRLASVRAPQPPIVKPST